MPSSVRALLVRTVVIAASALFVATACGGDPAVSSRPGARNVEDAGVGGTTGTGGSGTGDTGNQPTIDFGGMAGETDGGTTDPCDVAEPPPECFEPQPSGPGCGDGEINQDEEQCDDNNGLPGDGCSGICQKEPYFRCETPGAPCELTIACGDGVVDPGEFCDDGNTDDDDGCSADCEVQDTNYVCPEAGEPCKLLYDCGDSRVNGSEECDDGNEDEDDGCSSSCKVEDGWVCRRPGMDCVLNQECGDGILQTSRGEECDDGNSDWGDGCTANCIIDPHYTCDTPGELCTFDIVCGDGVRDPGEPCDDGNDLDGDGCEADDAGKCAQDPAFICAAPGANCTRIYACGDGRLHACADTGCETCDDGNTDDGDGCHGDCTVEPGYVCRHPGQPCALDISCGDGMVQASLGELCDDGNTDWDDGCYGDCTVAPYYSCPSGGGSCTSTIVCGDGKRDPGEACDDGATSNGDGCADDCTIETNWSCTGAAGGLSTCKKLVDCGDKRVNGAEECDDGNKTSNDGCSSTCLVESGYVCSTPGAICSVKVVCGDGKRAASEQCDDGGTAAGNGCSAQCKIENDYNCTGAVGGESACTSTVKCNDGIVSGAEVCDDGNTVGGDGCSGDCSTIETGFKCTRPGFPCRPICGDGKKLGDEQCDDGGTLDGNGCDANCRLEDNSVCDFTVSPNTCQLATCGSFGKQGTEPCDDGNQDWGDGCTPACAKEPTCANGAACSSACGDGIKFPAEACDDGNVADGDGCSATCAIEPGYSCTTAGGSPTLLDLPMVVRDFKPAAPFTETADPGLTSGHSDFQWGSFGNGDPDAVLTDNWTNYPTLPGTGDAFTGGRTGNILGSTVTLGGGGGMEYGFVNTALGSDKKPVFKFLDSDVGTATCPLTFGALIRGSQAFCVRQVQNATSFAGWYHDVDAYNNTYARTLPLHRCTGSEPPSGDSCSGMLAGTYVYDSAYTRADGSAYPTPGTGYKGFWPLDDIAGVTKFGQCAITGQGTAPNHNFHFTSEVHHWFQFDSAAPPRLVFTGDDDVWVFIAGQLVLDLGGTHPAAQGTVALTAAGNADVTRPNQNLSGTQTNSMTLGLVNNSIYEIVVFQAERNTCDSNYRLSLQNFNLRKSTCTPICGVNPDSTVTLTPPEECDDGAGNTNTVQYGKCLAGACTLGPYCGDGTPNGPETCDNGSNSAQYGQSGCAPGCVLPAECGDGNIDTPFEECDLGTGNTVSGYNGCKTDCTIGPRCGDGLPNGAEACDDGVNDGSYGTCSPGCTPAPKCGDGTIDSAFGEVCDGGASCDANCQLKCGNDVVDSGEACDDGVNAGGYNRCGPGCVIGDRCGDGTRNGPEECDDGVNDGGYGECAPGCKNGPFCGDAVVTSPETCDDGFNDAVYLGCYSNCTPGPQCGDSLIQAEFGELCDDALSPATCLNCKPLGTCGDTVVNPPEECDDGENDGGYGECGLGCVQGPGCGDGVVQAPQEQCDEGPGSGLNDGGYDECTDHCQFGPFCGDGAVDPDNEVCDDGINDSFYGSCTLDCQGFGPRCGDNQVQEEWGEECDDKQDPNCKNCRLGAQCGDNVVQSGEECDDGTNDGGYGQCGPSCQYGPRCGDGVVQTKDREQCDNGDGKNNGAYGGCEKTCKYAAHCGDGKIQKPFEQCDDGNNKNADGCSSACKKETQVPR